MAPLCFCFLFSFSLLAASFCLFLPPCKRSNGTNALGIGTSGHLRITNNTLS